MKSVHVTGPDTESWVEIDAPTIGATDVLLKIKACGICGSDAMYSHNGGIPPRHGRDAARPRAGGRGGRGRG